MVADDGLTIHSVSDSPYHMAQPHSLVQFLDQERKLDAIAQTRNMISEHEKNIFAHENADDPELETKIRSTDEDCILGGSVSSSKDAFLSAYTLGKLVEDFAALAEIEFIEKEEEVKKEPFCSCDLPFSIYAFEHFPSVQQRDTLKIIPEAVFENLLPSDYGIVKFGSHLAKALTKKAESAPFLRLAALYWRIKGDAPRAVECFRRAAHFTADTMQARTWFDFGNLVHRAGYPSDAIILYKLALQKIDVATIHMALGDAYALIQNRTEAVEQYEIAFTMEPTMKNAQVKAAALKCDLKLIIAMEEQHKNLLDTIKEKNLYNDRYESVKTMEEDVRKNVADVDVRMQSALIYDYFTYGSLPHSNCRSVTVSGRLLMQCTVSDWRRYRTAREERHRKLVANAKRNAARNMEQNVGYRAEESATDLEELKIFLRKLEPMKGMDMDEPVSKPVYPKNLSSVAKSLREIYMSSNWPNRTLCETDRWRFPVPTPGNLPELFMSPENKGYRPSDLLGKYLGLNEGQEHPLPWHQPACDDYLSDHSTSPFFKLSGIRVAASSGQSLQLAEEKLRSVFLKLLDDKVTEADIGQRISTLMKYKIGPQWLVFNLAALYWRVFGAPAKAVTCLHAALQMEPERYADVALVQLAQIVIRCSTTEDHLDDTVVLLNSALRINPNEPITHFLMGIVRILQKKYVTALAYVRAAVLMDPLFQPAVSVMHALKCLDKNQHRSVSERLHLRCCSETEPNVFCLGARTDGCFTISQKHAYMGTTCSDKKTENCIRAINFAPFIASGVAKTRETVNKVQGQVKSQAKVSQRKTIIDVSDEIPLDYGAEESIKKIKQMSTPSTKGFFQGEVVFAINNTDSNDTEIIESWMENVPVDKIIVPEWRLTLARVPERRRMIAFDTPLPSLLPLPKKDQVKNGLRHVPLPASRASNNNFCANTKMSLTMLREQSTSTWLSVTAKGMNLEKLVDFRAPVDLNEDFEPVCPELLSPSPLRTLDHLPAFHLRNQFIYYKPEKALTDAFLKLGNEKERVEVVAKRLKNAMASSSEHNEDDNVHWALSTASALYWRVKGDAVNALKCLRHSLNTAPPDMRDVALVSMANIYQQAGLLHSALIAGGSALAISPKLVAIHFTLANIYASLEKYQHALMFYYSTLSMQSNFEPAKERIRTIYCFTEKSARP